MNHGLYHLSHAARILHNGAVAWSCAGAGTIPSTLARQVQASHALRHSAKSAA